MPAILAVTVPFFGLVLCGYLAARLRLMPEATIPGLNAFVLFFALPCMLFRFGASTPVDKLLNPAMLAVWSLAALAIVAFTIRVTRGPHVNLKDAAFGALVAAFPNTGFMGMPLMTALLGAAAAGPMMVTLLIDMFITSSVCLALAQMHDNAHLPLGRRLRNALRGPIGNPQPWAIALGALFSAYGLGLPGPIDRMVELLAGAATPVALFTIGAVLYRAGQHAHSRTAPALFVPVALIKLAVHPALVFGLGSAAIALGAPLSRFELMVLTLAAALPSASNVSLLAERFLADNGRIARIIMTSTVLAFLSFSGLAGLFGATPG
ncbi:MAG: AEC family transporter [Methylibium sp.]|uniref:AEC family transporter n=1 Tax=Methylibium sp. TaxID=2067992 RepID=UPI0017B83AE5|nr:AEC family transporter [Methylibium sp.]MBA3596952.1 AEC family transporter [Methylibium sp.]